MSVDQHGNKVAQEGVDRCDCGCKYWEKDRCIDCRSFFISVQFRTDILAVRGA